MDRSVVKELHYITPKKNLESIAEIGLLSHNEAKSQEHESVALEVVQDRRRGKRVPNGGFLHSYANLYFDARNPMMSKLLADGREGLMVIRVMPDVLDLPNVVISDGNAATGTTRFFPSPSGLEALTEDRVYATYWIHNDEFEYYERKRQRCAEVLVPDRVLPSYIIGCYTSTQRDQAWCTASQPNWKVEVNRNVYFRH
ncbi:DUF4433 domain-containing protein [Streptomyces niveus]|uniref:DUF4433 domain-containing protein n=1 Tax=Streptomyces niveus TaxID=193462 RepID=UPI0035E02A16